MSTLNTAVGTSAAYYTFPGFWLGLAMAVLMFVNAARTLLDPTGFAAYMGLPLQDPMGLAWVRVYGLRALFIGLVVGFFLLREDAASLKWLAGLALVMSLGDAWLVSTSNGGTVLRHLITSGILVVAALSLHFWDLARGAMTTMQSP